MGWKWAEQGVWKERKALRGKAGENCRKDSCTDSFFVAGAEAESEMPVAQIRLCWCFLCDKLACGGHKISGSSGLGGTFKDENTKT